MHSLKIYYSLDDNLCCSIAFINNRRVNRSVEQYFERDSFLKTRTVFIRVVLKLMTLLQVYNVYDMLCILPALLLWRINGKRNRIVHLLYVTCNIQG
jgi:hypothetical protein